MHLADLVIAVGDHSAVPAAVITHAADGAGGRQLAEVLLVPGTPQELIAERLPALPGSAQLRWANSADPSVVAAVVNPGWAPLTLQALACRRDLPAVVYETCLAAHEITWEELVVNPAGPAPVAVQAAGRLARSGRNVSDRARRAIAARAGWTQAYFDAARDCRTWDDWLPAGPAIRWLRPDQVAVLLDTSGDPAGQYRAMLCERSAYWGPELAEILGVDAGTGPWPAQLFDTGDDLDARQALWERRGDLTDQRWWDAFEARLQLESDAAVAGPSRARPAATVVEPFRALGETIPLWEAAAGFVNVDSPSRADLATAVQLALRLLPGG